MSDPTISRRQAMGTCSLAVLGLVSGPTLGEAGNKGPAPNPPQKPGEGSEKPKAFSERRGGAGGMLDWQQMMKDQMASQQQRAFDSLKRQLRLSEKEWTVIQPRLQAVYDLVHPQPPMVGPNEPAKTEVEQRSRELRELLRDEKVEAGQIKARLTALRAAKERTVQELIKARQSLRQILTLRQEAILVLNGLLD